MSMATDCGRDPIVPCAYPVQARTSTPRDCGRQSSAAIRSHYATAAPSSCHSSTVVVFVLGAPSRSRASVHPVDFPTGQSGSAGARWPPDPGEADCTFLPSPPGLMVDESVSHQWLRTPLAGRGRRDEIAGSNHRTYPIEHRTGDCAVGAVPECSDYRRWPGALLPRRWPGSLLLPQLLLAGPILRGG